MKNFHDQIKLQYKDYPIGGKLIQAQVILPEEDIRSMTEIGKKQVREELVRKLVNDILDRGLVNFVQQPLDPVSFVRRVTATMYLAPDSTVQILRTVEKKNNGNE